MAKAKLVLAWVDNTGFRLTGGYHDRYRQSPKCEAVPEAKACVWGDDTPAMRDRLASYVKTLAGDYLWTGTFSLPNTSGILDEARQRALKAYNAA